MVKCIDAYFDPARPARVECDPDCELCSKLHIHALNVCMEGEGPDNADMMILGEAPGATEDELNTPFVGQAGEFLRDDLLMRAKIPESKIRFSNTVRCRPPKNRNPTASEIKKCRPYLVREINRIKPKVIVGMGNVPLATMLSRFYKGASEEGTAKTSDAVVGGITQWRGKLIWLREFDCWFMPTFHPSYCMRNERGHSVYSTEQTIKDLQRAWELAQKPLYVPSMIKTHVIEQTEKVRAVFQKMRENGTFAFDIETGINDVDPNVPRIIGFSLACSKTEGYYIPWSLIESSERLKRALWALLSDGKLTKVMHNGAYEVRVFRLNGYPIHDRYFDTMIGAGMIDENFRKGLKDLTWITTDFGGYDVLLEKYKTEHRIKRDYSKIPYEMLSEYGAYDAIATWCLYLVQKERMEQENLLPLFNKVSMPFRRVLDDVEYNGIYVDERQAKRVKAAGETALQELTDAVYDCAGMEFNIGSRKQLSDVLYKKMKFRPLKETKTGYSTDKESIEFIATQPNGDIAKYLSDMSYINTLLGTHISQALGFRWPDGRIHGHYNSVGTVTGRISCSSPSLQNVPQDALIRSIYTATPGNYLIEADLKSAELATIAAVSGEETFLEAFANGLDPHAQTYRRIYGLDSSYTPTKLERRQAKTINFGLVYGISAAALARRLDMTIEEATEFMNLYFERLPKIAAWMERQKKLAKAHGYVVSVFNRKRRLPMAMSDSFYEIGRAERQAMNAPIQSGAADYTYIGLIRLARALRRGKFESRIVHTVHDCGLADTVPHERDAVVDEFHRAFETPVKAMPVNMKIDVEVNRRWGENNESRLQEIFDKFKITV